jgi:hypothetical protein
VARLSVELAPIDAETLGAMRPDRPEPTSRANPYGPAPRPDFDEPI